MTLGVDYSFGRPDLGALAAAGVTHVLRYLSWLPNPKVVDAAELAALRAAGFRVGLNWEYDAHDQLHGREYGLIQAGEAVRQAEALGYPHGSCIFYSADWDATPEQQQPINDYLSACREVHAGRYLVGVYGGYYVVKRALDAGVCDLGWQTYAWSGDQWDDGDPRLVVEQYQNGVQLGGAEVDMNHVIGNPHFWGDDPGAPAPNPVPVPTPAPPAGGTYTVQPGDSLSSIAAKLGLPSWQALYALNRDIVGPNPDRIFPGEDLRTGAGGGGGAYRVEPGDSLSGIAAKLGIGDWHVLWDANRATVPNPDRIFPGQLLRVP